MTRVRRAAASLAVMLAIGAQVGAARHAWTASGQITALPNVQQLGPQVGERVPDFTLNDQRGHPRTLTSLVGPSGLMLVFFRSADW